MERIFTNALKKQLKHSIKGSISVHVVNDTLIVDINTTGYFVWRYTINNLAFQLSTSLNSKIASDDIVKQYKTYVLKQYFR